MILTAFREYFIQFILSNGTADPWKGVVLDAARYKYRRMATKMTVRDGNRLFIKGREVLSQDDIKQTINDTYHDPSRGYINPLAIFRKLREQYANIRLSDCRDVIGRDETYQRHRKVYKTVGRSNTAAVHSVLSYFQLDLTGPYDNPVLNRGYTYILAVVDGASKYLITVPLKNKSGAIVAKGIEQAINEIDALRIASGLTNERIRIQSDNGSEFISKESQKVFNDNNVIHLRSEAQRPESNSLVERVQQTLKGILYRFMSANNTKKWIDVLEMATDNINSNIHSATGKKPIDVINDEKNARSGALESIEKKNEESMRVKGRLFERLHVGDSVRLVLPKNERQVVNITRGYLKQWGKRVYTIHRAINPGKPNERFILADGDTVFMNQHKRDDLLKIVV
jgi:hypothetical protein